MHTVMDSIRCKKMTNLSTGFKTQKRIYQLSSPFLVQMMETAVNAVAFANTVGVG